MKEYEFMECAVCAAKPGSPPLCETCQHNRTVIHVLALKLAEIRTILDGE